MRGRRRGALVVHHLPDAAEAGSHVHRLLLLLLLLDVVSVVATAAADDAGGGRQPSAATASVWRGAAP